jgi:uncharacterized protein with PQ loop repeat
MSEEVIEIVFTALGVLFVFPRIPQLVRIYKRKSSLDISITYWNLLNILTLPWLWYFWHKNSMSAFISNLLAMILNNAVVLLAYRYRRK